MALVSLNVEVAIDTAVALLAEGNAERLEPMWSRDEAIARYRQLRAVSKQHNSGAMKLLSRDAILQHARRLGLAQGKTLILDNADQLAMVYDLAIYTAPADRSRAIDRYARSARFAAGSDEALVLEAQRQTRFAIVSVTRRHPAAGLIVTTLGDERELWLMDEGLEASLPVGAVFAARFYAPDRFFMTAGVVIPVDSDLVTSAAESAPYLMRKPLAEAVEDRRFAEALYRTAIADGTMHDVVLQDAPAPSVPG
jgi:hypothetical protein